MRVNKPVIIALTGPAGSGKTSVARELEGYGFARVRFAGPLKAMLVTLGLTEDQVDGDEKETPCDLLCGRSPRQAMQTLGLEWGRVFIGPDVWINAAMKLVDEHLARGTSVVIDDCRFDNEARALAGRGACIFELVRAGAGTDHEHASEAGISRGWVTDRIDNNGDLDDTVAIALSIADSRRRAAG